MRFEMGTLSFAREGRVARCKKRGIRGQTDLGWKPSRITSMPGASVFPRMKWADHPCCQVVATIKWTGTCAAGMERRIGGVGNGAPSLLPFRPEAFLWMQQLKRLGGQVRVSRAAQDCRLQDTSLGCGCGWRTPVPANQDVVLPRAGPREVAAERIWNRGLLRGRRGLVSVQRVCPAAGAAADAPRAVRHPDKAGASGLNGQISYATRKKENRTQQITKKGHLCAVGTANQVLDLKLNKKTHLYPIETTPVFIWEQLE